MAPSGTDAGFCNLPKHWFCTACQHGTMHFPRVLWQDALQRTSHGRGACSPLSGGWRAFPKMNSYGIHKKAAARGLCTDAMQYCKNCHVAGMQVQQSSTIVLVSSNVLQRFIPELRTPSIVRRKGTPLLQARLEICKFGCFELRLVLFCCRWDLCLDPPRESRAPAFVCLGSRASASLRSDVRSCTAITESPRHVLSCAIMWYPSRWSPRYAKPSNMEVLPGLFLVWCSCTHYDRAENIATWAQASLIRADIPGAVPQRPGKGVSPFCHASLNVLFVAIRSPTVSTHPGPDSSGTHPGCVSFPKKHLRSFLDQPLPVLVGYPLTVGNFPGSVP